jgi:hypothetical protein
MNEIEIIFHNAMETMSAFNAYFSKFDIMSKDEFMEIQRIEWAKTKKKYDLHFSKNNEVKE